MHEPPFCLHHETFTSLSLSQGHACYSLLLSLSWCICLLRASGFGRTIGASLHEDGRTPINFSCRHRTYMASGIPLPLLFQLDRSTTLPKRASTLAYNLNDVSMITIAIRSVNNSVFQKGANVQLIMLQGPYHQ